MSRFLGKVSLEILASRVLEVKNWNVEIVEKVELDSLRDFVRYNKGDWPFAFRTLYPVNAIFTEEEESYELLHEYDLLWTSSIELYAIVAILGVEFAFNLVGPEVDGYIQWLKENQYQSPLYP